MRSALIFLLLAGCAAMGPDGYDRRELAGDRVRVLIGTKASRVEHGAVTPRRSQP